MNTLTVLQIRSSKETSLNKTERSKELPTLFVIKPNKQGKKAILDCSNQNYKVLNFIFPVYECMHQLGNSMIWVLFQFFLFISPWMSKRALCCENLYPLSIPQVFLAKSHLQLCIQIDRNTAWSIYKGHSNMRSGLFFPTLPYSLFLLVRLSVRMSQNTAVAHKSLHYDPPHRAKRCSKIVIINITIIKHNAVIRKTSASEGREGPSQAGSKAQSRPERPQPWSRFSKGS